MSRLETSGTENPRDGDQHNGGEDDSSCEHKPGDSKNHPQLKDSKETQILSVGVKIRVVDYVEFELITTNSQILYTTMEVSEDEPLLFQL